MPIRVTQQTFYRQTITNVLRRNYQLAELNAQIASGSRILQPSDDPVSSIAAHSSNRMLEEIEQYNSNLDHGRDWLQQGESSLRRMSEVLTMIKERSEQMATGTYTDEQRQMIATDARNFFDQLVELCNSRVAGENIFSGTRVKTPAVNPTMTADNPAVLEGTHTEAGRLYGLGTYTGHLSRDVTLTVDAAYAGGTPSAANPMDVDYSYIDDFGRTITGTTTIEGTGTGFAKQVGDGVSIYTDDQNFAAGEAFTLEIGRYQGNEEDLEMNLSWDNRMRYNYTLEEFFQAEGNDGSGWGSVLDQVENWIYALERDSKERDYFEALPGTGNNPASSPFINFTGDYARLNARNVNVYVGGPLQSPTDNADIAYYRDFTVDAGYAGGAPSADNPMTLNYEFWDGAAWQNGAVNITGTGSGSTQTIADAAVSMDLYMVDAAFTAGTVLPDPGGPIQSANTPAQLAYYRNFTVDGAYAGGIPGPFPNDMDLDYEYWDGAAWQAATVNVTGTGAGSSVTLQSLAATGGAVEIYMSDVGFDAGDSWAKLPMKIGEEFTPLPGPPAVSADVTYTYQGDASQREYTSDTISGTGEDQEMTLSIGTDTFTVYIPTDGELADNDSWSLTLEQYNQAQETSQELLPELETMMGNLLTYVADAGSRLNRLDVRETLFDDDILRLYDRLSASEDVDVTQAITELTTTDIMYQAALQATSLVSGRNLSDYL